MFPAEIWVQILGELRWRELVPLRQVCQQFDSLICDQLQRRRDVRECVFYALYQKVAVLTVEQLRWAVKTFQYSRLDFFLTKSCFLKEVIRLNRRDLLTLILREITNHNNPPTFTLPDLSKFCNGMTMDGLGLFLWGVENDAAYCCDLLQDYFKLAVPPSLVFKSAILKRSKKVIVWLMKRHSYLDLALLLLTWEGDSVYETKDFLLQLLYDSFQDTVQEILPQLYDPISLHYSVVAALLQLRYWLPSYSKQLRLLAADKGDLLSLKVLHKQGVKIRSKRAVCKAAFESGNVEVIKWITKKKWANPYKDTFDQYVLIVHFIANKKMEALQYLKQTHTWELNLTERESQIDILATGSTTICRLFKLKTLLVLDRWELKRVLHSCAEVATKQFIDNYLEPHISYIEPEWYRKQLVDLLTGVGYSPSAALTKWLLKQSYDSGLNNTFGGMQFTSMLQLITSHSQHVEQVCKYMMEGYLHWSSNMTARGHDCMVDRESLFMVTVPLSVLQYMIRVLKPTRQLLHKVYLHYCLALKIDIVMWLKEEYNF